MTNVLNNATTALIYASWFGSLAFVIGYTVVARWWRSTVGRQMFALGAVILAIATLAVLSQLFGQDYSARPWVRFAVWAATASVTVGLCVALVKAQRRGR